jgi:hypothetical protein
MVAPFFVLPTESISSWLEFSKIQNCMWKLLVIIIYIDIAAACSRVISLSPVEKILAKPNLEFLSSCHGEGRGKIW